MRPRAYGILALLLLFLLAFPLAISAINYGTLGGISQTSHVLAPSNQSYKENLSVYLTSGQSFWKTDYSGGNITIASVNIPSSVTGYSITLTNYQTWKSQYELFTRYGFGLLGSNEPTPGGAYLQVNTSSSSGAQSLVQSLSQRFGLVFEPLLQTSTSFTFFAPLNFNTEMHVYFWKLVPISYGGFAAFATEQTFESASLSYYKLAYSSSSYSISIGEIASAAGTQFKLYSALGLTGQNYTYSKYASSSSISVHVLGGLITNASIPFSNNYSNLSASMNTTSQSGNGTIPNLNATLNLSFPTLIAYRQISTLTPTTGTNVTATIFIKDVSPSGAPAATDVTVNDSWLKSYSNVVQLTNGNASSSVASLSSNAVTTVAYSFRVTASNGTINIPATPVTYQFLAGNKSVNSVILLNPETIYIGTLNTPALEATASVTSSSLQVGQAFGVNVTIINKGSGTAFNVKSSGLTKSDLPSGSTWSFITNTSSASLTQTNVNVSYSVSWSDSSGANHSANTNTLSAVFGFGSPATPAVGVNKLVAITNSSNVANVTLVVYNSSPNEVKNVSIFDPLPSGVTFARSSNSTQLKSSGNDVNGNLSVLAGNSNATLHYLVNISNVNENYVFMPASISAAWNSITITHYSNGISLPLGVVASKSISPNQGFQGSNVTVSIGVTNKGSLPIYFLSLNNTLDSFMNETKSASNYAADLNNGQGLNASTIGNLVGNQGHYNSSSAVASFIFGGSNETASSKPVSVSVYGLVEANFSTSALKYEENHNINITVTITNPSNVTVSNVKFGMHIPQGLQIVGNGQTNFTIGTLSPGQTQHISVIVITNQPNVYSMNDTNAQLTFTYHGLALKGAVSSLTLSLSDDLTLRYGIPIVIAVAFVLGTLFYVRRLQKSK